MLQVFWAAIISSATTVLGVGFVAYLLKNWILVRLTKSIQHEYDTKLADINSELRKTENEIGDVRKAAISNAMISQGAIDKRRLEAIDHIWQGFMDSKKNIIGVTVLATLNIQEVSKSIDQGKVKLFIDTISKSINLNPKEIYGEPTKLAQSARPWVGPKIWTIYTAYNSVIFYPIAVFMAFKEGVKDPLKYIKRDKIVDDVRKALPDLKIDWDNLHDAVLPTLLELLEINLLQEIEFIISGKRSDIETHQRAVNMAKNLEQLNKNANAENQQQK